MCVRPFRNPLTNPRITTRFPDVFWCFSVPGITVSNPISPLCIPLYYLNMYNENNNDDILTYITTYYISMSILMHMYM